MKGKMVRRKRDEKEKWKEGRKEGKMIVRKEAGGYERMKEVNEGRKQESEGRNKAEEGR